MASPRSAFSLVELLVVLGITALLLALTIPAIEHARAAADKVACQSKLRQIGLALQLYHNDHGHLPPHRPKPWLSSPDGAFTWNTLLLPYVEQQRLGLDALAAFAQDRDPFHNPPHVGLGTVVDLYICPTDSRLRQTFITPTGLSIAYTSYLGIPGGANNILDGTLDTYPSGASFEAIHDGLSNTLMVGERPPPDTFEAGFVYTRYSFGSGFTNDGPHARLPVLISGSPPGDPCIGPFQFGPGRTDNPCDKYHYWSLHPGGGNFAFADASVRFLRYSARPIMVALGTRNGGEAVELPD